MDENTINTLVRFMLEQLKEDPALVGEWLELEGQDPDQFIQFLQNYSSE